MIIDQLAGSNLFFNLMLFLIVRDKTTTFRSDAKRRGPWEKDGGEALGGGGGGENE